MAEQMRLCATALLAKPALMFQPAYLLSNRQADEVIKGYLVLLGNLRCALPHR